MSKRTPVNPDENDPPILDVLETAPLVIEAPPAQDPPMPTPVIAPQNTLSLDEFCQQLSLENRRYALIGGFHMAMRCAGRLEDTEATYRAEFARFIRS